MVIIFSSLSFDLSDPRDRANSCYMNNSVGIDRDIATVFQFIRCRIPEIYSALTDMYPFFDILTTGDLAGKIF